MTRTITYDLYDEIYVDGELINEELHVFDRLDSIADPKEFIGHIELEGDKLLLFKADDKYCACLEKLIPV